MIIRNKSELSKVLKLLNSSLYWSYDIETSGLNPRSDKIIGFGCANPQNLNEAFYIIMKEWNGTELVTVLQDSDVAPIIQELKSKRLITFNGSFDTRFTYHYFGIDLIQSIYSDEMLATHTLDENRMDYKLKNITAELFGEESKDAQANMLASIKENGGTEKEYYKANSTLMATYGIQDNILTARLHNHNKRELAKQGLTKFFYEDEVMPLYTNVTIYMELKGVQLDLPLMQETLEQIKVDLIKIERSIQEEINPNLSEFNEWYMNKEYPIQLSGQFLEELAVQIAPLDWPRTKAGGYSFSSAAFKKKQHLLTHELYLYQNGQKRIPRDLAKKVQESLLNKSGAIYTFNILSKHHLKKLLFEKLQETPLSFTDKGNAQVTDELLDLLASKYNWVNELRTYNKLIKIKSTYIERFLEKQENGIFYPSFYQHRTDSGRYSGDLQQLSKPYEEEQLKKGEVDVRVYTYTNRIRRFFISGANNIFADFDYDSQEVKVFGHVSKEERIKDIFRKGYDFYSQICIATEGLTDYSADKKASNYLGKKNKPARQRAKSYALGLAFNMSPYALSKDLGISESEAAQIHKSYFNSFPDLKVWVEQSKQFAIENGYVKTEAGRIRRLTYLKEMHDKYGPVLFDSLELLKKYSDNTAQYKYMKEVSKRCRSLLNVSVNFQVQSLAASITNRAAVACAKELRKLNLNARICSVLHDQITVVSSLEHKDKASEILESSMSNTYKISLPLTAPPSWGTNWAESK